MKSVLLGGLDSIGEFVVRSVTGGSMKGLKATLAVSALLALAPTAAQATTILVTTDSGLTTDGTIDWGTLGGPFTPVEWNHGCDGYRWNYRWRI